MSDVSIVIPTFNEAQCLEKTLRQLTLLDPPAKEVVVVDGGSEDETIAIALRVCETFEQQTTARVIRSQKKGRSRQMNRGAEVATGDILCFLHADTWVPSDFVAAIDRTLADPTVAGGGFISLMAGAETTRWGISLHNYLKTYYSPLLLRPHLFVKGLRVLFGDQAIFCRSKLFWDCGGFDANLPIMEDADLCVKLVERGRIHLVNRVVESSDRRVAKWGSLKATAIYTFIGFMWAFGVDARYLKPFYEDIR